MRKLRLNPKYEANVCFYFYDHGHHGLSKKDMKDLTARIKEWAKAYGYEITPDRFGDSVNGVEIVYTLVEPGVRPLFPGESEYRLKDSIN